MKTLAAALLAVTVLWAAAPRQDPAKDQLRQALKDNNLVGPWIYDDLDRGYDEAKQTGKPLMVVLRCVT